MAVLHKTEGQIDTIGWLFVAFVGIAVAVAVMAVLSQ
jgi:hypothetical protein